jgi:hypothetical protein
VPRAGEAWRKFMEIYGNLRTRAARALCIDFLAAKNTVLSTKFSIVIDDPARARVSPD